MLYPTKILSCNSCSTLKLLKNHTVLSKFKQATNTNVQTLVIVTGHTRSSAYAWKFLNKHVLKPLNAYLATYFTDDCASTELAKIATYKWSAPAQTDWGFF